MLIDRVQLRPADREEMQENPHHQPDVVAPEGNPPWPLVENGARSCAIAEAEIDEAERKQPERAEQRGMGMVEGQESAMLVVVDERRVKGAAAEDARPDEIPERRAEDVQISKRVIECCGPLDQAVLRNRLQDQQHQR
jgi:hypothetical protein